MPAPWEDPHAPAWENKEMFNNLVESDLHKGKLRGKLVFPRHNRAYALFLMIAGVVEQYALTRIWRANQRIYRYIRAP